MLVELFNFVGEFIQILPHHFELLGGPGLVRGCFLASLVNFFLAITNDSFNAVVFLSLFAFDGSDRIDGCLTCFEETVQLLLLLR
jgi:hypothetical protein